VTELVARPLIALLFPELADVVQPLAGEWAVRRSLLARLTVPVGYAVELAVLVDTVRLLGLPALAQVDLGVRAHRHQALLDLGGMATQILAAALARAAHLPADSALLRQFTLNHGPEPMDREVLTLERPPAEEVA
jgi:glucosyl-3-phosphoglycerate synthase